MLHGLSQRQAVPETLVSLIFEESQGYPFFVEEVYRHLIEEGKVFAVDRFDAMADFRAVHYGWAQEYINRRTDDPRGTGGTPYMEWLRQLIEETHAFKIV